MDRLHSIKAALSVALEHKKLTIPTASFHRANLKNDVVLKPLVKQFSQNRYKIFLQNIRSFLGTDVIQVGEIYSFAKKLFAVIDNDIVVLQQNQQTRQLSTTNQKKLIHLQKQLKALKIQLISNTEQIRSFDQMLQFTGGVLAVYNKRLNQCKQIYEQMYKVQIYTTLQIETIYDSNVSEDYYDKYQNQLLQVMKRMRGSLNILSQQIKMASNVDIPLRCHNFLVNCRNLILELQSFLIEKNCVFNRLLSYVITIHQKNLNELLDIASDKGKINTIIFQIIYKNFYMFKLFEGDISKVQKQLQISKNDIELSFQNKNFNQVSKIARQCLKQVQHHCQTLKDIKLFISNIDQDYMQFVTRVQLNVKTKRLKDVKNSVKQFQSYVNMLMKLGQNDRNLKQKQVQLKHNGQKLSKSLSDFVQKTLPFNETVFKKVFLEIQERLIQITTIQENLNNLQVGFSSDLQNEYIAEKLKEFQNIREMYFRTEKGLLGLVDDSRRGYQQQSSRNIMNADEILQKCNKCLQELNPSAQSDIYNWQSKDISRQNKFLQKIVNAQGRIHKQKQLYQQKQLFEDALTSNKKKQIQNELARMRINFQSLLRIYDTLVVPGTLTGIASKISFQSKQQAKLQIQQNKQFMAEFNQYFDSIKQNESPTIKNQLDIKVQQINKQRYYIMQQIINTYACIFELFASLKTTIQPEELRNKYVPIGNEKVLNYLTKLFLARKQMSNRVRQIKQNSKLHSKTKQFLEVKIQDVLISLQVNIQMIDLQKYIIALGKSLNYNSKMQQLINSLIQRVNNPKNQMYKGRIIGASEDLVDFKNNFKVLQSLQNGPLGKMTYGNMKNDLNKMNDFFKLAQQILLQKTVQKMILDVQLRDQKANNIKKKILQNIGV